MGVEALLEVASNDSEALNIITIQSEPSTKVKGTPTAGELR